MKIHICEISYLPKYEHFSSVCLVIQTVQPNQTPHFSLLQLGSAVWSLPQACSLHKEGVVA